MVPNGQLLTSIGLRDKDFLPVVTQDIPGRVVDLLIQSPGGSAEATETLVEHLRSRFDHIRVMVPGTAKSAATMLAMSADEILMDDLSELGPTDPQIWINNRFSPAGAITKQFALAVQSLKHDAGAIRAWLPVLQMYGPSLLQECDHHLQLSRQLVSRWLHSYMLKDVENSEAKSAEIAEWLSIDDNFKTHARRVGVAELRDKGVKAIDMRENPQLQDGVRAVYYATMSTFDGTGVFKLFENSENKRLAQNVAVQIVQAPPNPQPPMNP